VELAVTMMLFGLVSVVAFHGLDSMTRASAGVSDRARAVADTRSAIELLVRDLRGANPIDALDALQPVSTYDASISFSVYCDASGVNGCVSNLRKVTYAVAGNELTRTQGGVTSTLVGPEPSGRPVAERRGAVVNSAAQPVFVYFDLAGDRLETTGPFAVASSTFRDCAQSVAVHLVVMAVPGDPRTAVDMSTRVDLRNYNEVGACTI
jgi:hypothetical protein